MVHLLVINCYIDICLLIFKKIFLASFFASLNRTLFLFPVFLQILTKILCHKIFKLIVKSFKCLTDVLLKAILLLWRTERKYSAMDELLATHAAICVNLHDAIAVHYVVHVLMLKPFQRCISLRNKQSMNFICKCGISFSFAAFLFYFILLFIYALFVCLVRRWATNK